MVTPTNKYVGLTTHNFNTLCNKSKIVTFTQNCLENTVSILFYLISISIYEPFTVHIIVIASPFIFWRIYSPIYTLYQFYLVILTSCWQVWSVRLTLWSREITMPRLVYLISISRYEPFTVHIIVIASPFIFWRLYNAISSLYRFYGVRFTSCWQGCSVWTLSFFFVRKNKS